MENMDLLRDIRLAMGQIDPENAIALIKELIAETAPGGVKLVLQSQLTMYLNSQPRRTEEEYATLPMNGIPLAAIEGHIYLVAVGNNRPAYGMAVGMEGVESIKSLFDATSDIYYLNLAISMVQGVIATGSLHSPHWPYQLRQLALYLSDRCDILDAPHDLELAIKIMHDAIAKVPFSDPRKLHLLDTLSTLFHQRYERFEEPNDLEKAINATEEAIAVAPRDNKNRFARSMNLGGLHLIKFQCLRNLGDLDKAIQVTKEATPVTPQDHSNNNRFARSMNIGSLHLIKFQCLRNPSDLDKAMQVTKEATPVTPQDHSKRTIQLNSIRHEFYNRFLGSGDLNDLDQSIQVMEEEIAVMAVDNPIRVSQLNNLACQFKERFDISQELNDLTRSIQTIEEAIAVTPQDIHDRLSRLASLGGLLGIRFEYSENLEDIDRAIQVSKESRAATPPEHPKLIGRLHNLSLQFYHRFLRSRDLDDLGQSIQVIEEIIAAMAKDDPARVNQLDTLGSHLTKRFDECGDLNDLERSIQAIKEAIAITPRESHARPKRLIEFGRLLNRRFTSLVNLEDIDEAIEVSEQAALATPISHPDRPEILLSLACHLLMRSQHLETLDDLTRAIKILEETQYVTPSGHPCRGFMLNYLAAGFHGRFNFFGDLKDLDKAVEASAEAVAVTLPDNPALKIIMINHGISLTARFFRLGSPEDLDNAIQLTEDAVAAPRAGGGPGQVLLLNLGHILHTRFERFGAREDLDMAIAVAQEAVESTPSGHIERPVVLDLLAGNLRSRFGRSGAVSDLESAIELAEESVAVTPHDKPTRAERLHNLSIYFYTRYCYSGALEDLTRAIQTSQEAIDKTQAVHVDRARRLMTMSMLLGVRYHRSEAVEDLESSIEVGEHALQAFPIDHPSRANMSGNQGMFLEYRTVQSTPWARSVKKAKQAIELQFPQDSDHAALRWENIRGAVPDNRVVHSENVYLPDRVAVKDSKNSVRIMKAIQSIPVGPVPDFTESMNHFLMAWRCDTAPPLLRIGFARKAAAQLGLIGRWAEASSLLEAAMKILPTASPRFLSRDDQQFALSIVSELSADALSTALQAGLDTTHCLTLLELGRGIIMGFGIDCRSDLSPFENSKLFTEFSRLRIEVDSPVIKVPGASRQSTERRRRRRLQAIDEMGKTMASIRQQPGYEAFQQPLAPANLKAIGKEGAIIIINCTLNRSDAIMVTKSDIKLLRLPKLVLSEVEVRMKVLAALVRGSRATYNSRNEEIASVLLWLWEVVVEPVFNELGLHAVKSGELPRVWWIGVGCLSAAPFHAAGNHSRRSTRNTLSRAISSYIPTIKALSFARQKKLNLGPNCRLLLVTMPSTPNTLATPFISANTRPPTTHGPHGPPAMYRTDAILATPTVEWKPLRNAQTEVNDIFTVVNESSSPITTRFESPTVTQVLEELPYNHVIHFACHGVSDTINPSNSHLLLHGDDPSTLGKLNVKAISNMNIKYAQVAYLSACCTADNPSADLADESIHIASAFQLAGFSHVLGTLWDSNDEACRKVSVEFYRRLFHRDRNSDEGHRAVSTAFHHAVKKLRGEMRGQPIKWASFVHTGA